jgi:pyridoxine 5-phosphate synthase
MTKLSVNVNKIATLRNTRALGIPSVVKLSKVALDAGAAGITIHPRPDERHIRSSDVDELAMLMRLSPHAEFNIEGNPFHGLVEHCERVQPHQATLVPDAAEASTSNQGWRFDEMDKDALFTLGAAIRRLHAAGCRVSLFMDPVPELMMRAKEIGANRIELYTEPYASSFVQYGAGRAVAPYVAAAEAAREQGLEINAGHDLNLENLGPFLAAIPDVQEVSIGHALIGDALEFGMAETVRRYRAICDAS